VNNILQSGTVSTAPGAANGAALFNYDLSGSSGAATTLKVNPAITSDQLAPVDAAGNSNGNAIALAGLANATSGQGTIGGLSFGAYYAQIAAQVGTENQSATTNQSTQATVSAQAQALRDQLSGVSLDQEAVSLIQFQRGYEASAKVLTTLNTLVDATLSLIPQP
jgi:flagellar hook-associated protein 1 FlgK